MKINGIPYRSLWFNHDLGVTEIIDQRWLPHKVVVQKLAKLDDFSTAISEMRVRGAPLIGVTAAYGIAHQMAEDSSDTNLDQTYSILHETRPTAINLRWALDRCRAFLTPIPPSDRATAALQLAHQLADEDVEINHQIGLHGLKLIQEIADQKKGAPVNILTHCNAGWIATVDWGTATSPIYQAHDAGLGVHVWVGETRPRNQGALTAWELGCHGIAHTYITDNAGGLLMQRGEVDIVIVGTDRTTRSGDVCNKIGTYLKALAAGDNNVPFYVALPSSTIDWRVRDGFSEIPIEERDAREVSHIPGRGAAGETVDVQVTPQGTASANPAFDITPARLVTGLITERGIVSAKEEELIKLFPEHAKTIV